MEELKLIKQALNASTGNFTIDQNRDIANCFDSLSKKVSDLIQKNKELTAKLNEQNTDEAKEK